MPTAHRQVHPGLIQELFDAPHRFSFFQAVRLLELWLAQHGVDAAQAQARWLYFRNTLSLAYAPSDIEALEADLDGGVGALEEVLGAGHRFRIALTPAFMGYLGAQGTLPSHCTERLALRVDPAQQAAARAFFDTFSSRVLSLFYQSWRKRHMATASRNGRAALAQRLLALAGRVNPRPGRESDVLTSFAGPLRQRSASAAAIERVLVQYFGFAIDLMPNQGGWEALPRQLQACLGVQACVLGGGALLGERVWRRDLRVGLTLHPRDRRQFLEFVPGAPGAIALRDLLKQFAAATLRFDVCVAMPAGAMSGMRLGGDAQLGRDSFMLERPNMQERRDLTYTIQLM